MENETNKLPRIYVDHEITKGLSVALNDGQAHHLRGVLRAKDGEKVRIFNGRDGQWLAELSGKSALAIKALRAQSSMQYEVSLLFAPIKKERCSTLIAQTVELGVSELLPIKTQRTQGLAIKALSYDKLVSKTIAACEQSERLSIPKIHRLADLKDAVCKWPKERQLYICLERLDASNSTYISDLQIKNHCGFVVGAEGGFNEQETKWLADFAQNNEHAHTIWLGNEILRSETACALCLSAAKLGLGNEK